MLVKNMCDDIWVIPIPKNALGNLVLNAHTVYAYFAQLKQMHST